MSLCQDVSSRLDVVKMLRVWEKVARVLRSALKSPDVDDLIGQLRQ